MKINGKAKQIILVLAILVCAYIFFFHGLGSYSLKEPDEGRYAEIPREMVEQGDYLVPHLNHVRYFEKPPLLYWVTALSYKILGTNEWSFRLPNALMALLTVLATYLFAARRFGRRTALISSLILMSSFGFFAMARIVTTDMLFAFLLFASLLAFYQFYLVKRNLYLYLFYAALALSVLTKGPVAVVLLFATILVFLFIEKDLSFLKRCASPIGLSIFAVIAVPWFIAISLKEKEFFHFFFIDQHILRFLTTKHKRSGPLYYFIPVLFAGLFPWSVFLPRAVTQLWREKELRIFFIWSAVVFVFFSVSGSKLPPYILPIFPALAIILGYVFDKWREQITFRAEAICYIIFFVCLALAGGVFGSGLAARYMAGMPDIASLAPSIRGLSFGLAFVSLIIAILLFFRKVVTLHVLFYALAAFSLSVAAGLMLHAHVIDRLNTAKQIALAINNRQQENSLIVNYGAYHQTLPFYTGKRIYLADYDGELEMGSKYPDAQPYFINKGGLVQLWRSDKPIFVVLKAKRLRYLEELGIGERNVIQCENEICLLGNGRVLSTGRPVEIPSP